MLSRAYSGALMGVDAVAVEIEVNSGEKGEPKTFMVGLPDAAVKESLDRVSAALSNSGYSMPLTKMTINLAPGNIRKEGPIYDLPISLGVLASMGVLDDKMFADFVIAGELSLSGELRPVCGGVSFALLARRTGKRGVILPRLCAHEAALVDGIEVYAADSLKEICDCFRSGKPLQRISQEDSTFRREPPEGLYPDFADVKGQEHVMRAVEVAVAGGHNLLMIGPPGSGKSMIAKRIPSVMPTPSIDEFLEILGIYSAAGLSQSSEGGYFRRPFRSPHHTISDVGLIGGGANPRPGEISLAHNGVLFLDELPEFRRSALEVMRQPLEDSSVSISRSAGKITIPCRFMLVAAMNPCPCGYLGDLRKTCSCSVGNVQRYRSRISGPLLDRIDIHVEVASLPLEKLSQKKNGEASSSIKTRILSARAVQFERFKNSSASSSKTNSAMTSRDIKTHCHLSAELQHILSHAMQELNLSARAWDRILKVSRTIADMSQSEDIQAEHLLEAINYRSLDRRF